MTQLLSNGRDHLTATGVMQQDPSGFPRQCSTEALLDSQILHAVLNIWQAQLCVYVCRAGIHTYIK